MCGPIVIPEDHLKVAGYNALVNSKRLWCVVGLLILSM